MCDRDYPLEEHNELEMEATQSQSTIPMGEQQGTPEPGLLIEAVQNFEFLYDLSNKSYKDSKKKLQAWQHISTMLNCSVEECMKLWKHLRDRFVKEKNKFPSGAGAPYSNWPYFEAMLFYNKFTKKRKTYTATKNRLSESDLLSRPSSSSSAYSMVESLMSPEASPMEENLINQEQLPVASSSGIRRESLTSTTPTTSVAQRGRKRKVNQDEKLEEIMGMARSLTDVFESRQSIPRNANSAFAQYLFEELERMPEEDAKEKRKEILSILFNK